MTIRQKVETMPELLRFMALHGVIGIFMGCAVGGALLATDVAGIGSLVAASGTPLVAGGLYFSGFAVTFGSAMMASAVMLLSE